MRLLREDCKTATEEARESENREEAEGKIKLWENPCRDETKGQPRGGGT